MGINIGIDIGAISLKLAASGISHKIDNLVTLGAPIRPDYQFNESANKTPTTKGIIHYSQNGMHIMPARP